MAKRAAPIPLVAVTSPNARYKDAHEALAANVPLLAELILEGRRYRASLTQSTTQPELNTTSEPRPISEMQPQ